MSQKEYPGIFITFEGIEGVGKTTSLRFLAEHYHQQDIPILITREPGGTPLADEIRHFLLSEHEESIEPETELLLMFAARAQHISRVILPALAAGKAVFCDRFTDTSFAYQGAARGLGAEKIAVLQTLVQKDLTPDLTILLDAPVELALDRLQERAKTDRFESETSAFFQRARDAYLEMAIAEPERFRVIDATKSLEDVRQKMLSVINPLLEQITT